MRRAKRLLSAGPSEAVPRSPSIEGPTESRAADANRATAAGRASRMKPPSSVPVRMACRPKKLPGSRLPDFVLRDFRRLRRQREEREEVAASDRIRAEAALQVAEGTLVVEEGDDDAFRRGMLTLPQPRVPAARRRPDRRRMPPEDLDSLRLLALAE